MGGVLSLWGMYSREEKTTRGKGGEWMGRSARGLKGSKDEATQGTSREQSVGARRDYEGAEGG